MGHFQAWWFWRHAIKASRRQFADNRNMVGDADLHSRRHAQSFVDAAEIVMGDVQRDSGAMVQIGFAEGRPTTALRLAPTTTPGL